MDNQKEISCEPGKKVLIRISINKHTVLQNFSQIYVCSFFPSPMCNVDESTKFRE